MKSLKEKLSKFNRLFAAITFAEAGDHDFALKIMDANKKDMDKKDDVCNDIPLNPLILTNNT